jgi:hypothetical protein
MGWRVRAERAACLRLKALAKKLREARKSLLDGIDVSGVGRPRPQWGTERIARDDRHVIRIEETLAKLL